MAEIGVELDCLEGVKVVDFTQFEAAPTHAGRLQGSGEPGACS